RIKGLTVIIPRLSLILKMKMALCFYSLNSLLKMLDMDHTVAEPEDQNFRGSTYFKNSMFRVSPENLVLLTADFLKISLKTSSVISSQSFLVISSNLGFGLNKGSLCALENRFQGQTS